MSPLERLLKYINENIYTKMKKKDVKEIMSSSLGGELLHEIDVYKKACVLEEIGKIKSEGKSSVNNWDADKVYPKGFKFE